MGILLGIPEGFFPTYASSLSLQEAFPDCPKGKTWPAHLIDPLQPSPFSPLWGPWHILCIRWKYWYLVILCLKSWATWSPASPVILRVLPRSQQACKTPWLETPGLGEMISHPRPPSHPYLSPLIRSWPPGTWGFTSTEISASRDSSPENPGGSLWALSHLPLSRTGGASENICPDPPQTHAAGLVMALHVSKGQSLVPFAGLWEEEAAWEWGHGVSMQCLFLGRSLASVHVRSLCSFSGAPSETGLAIVTGRWLGEEWGARRSGSWVSPVPPQTEGAGRDAAANRALPHTIQSSSPSLSCILGAPMTGSHRKVRWLKKLPSLLLPFLPAQCREPHSHKGVGSHWCQEHGSLNHLIEGLLLGQEHPCSMVMREN